MEIDDPVLGANRIAVPGIRQEQIPNVAIADIVAKPPPGLVGWALPPGFHISRPSGAIGREGPARTKHDISDFSMRQIAGLSHDDDVGANGANGTEQSAYVGGLRCGILRCGLIALPL